MFGLFKKKDKKAELQKKYEALLKEAFDLSSTDRKASDIKQAEAEAVAKEIEALP
jgi:thiamine biosynthesis lipoprotein ApbE